MKKKNKKLKFFSLIFMTLFVLASQTIVYSAINGTMTIKGDAYARAEADVRITGLRLASVNNATSSYEEFGKNHIVTEVNLTNSSSSITYYVEITNYGSTDVGIFDITGLPNGVSYSIKGYNLHDKICDDTGKCNSFIKKTYEITLSTNSTYTGNVQLNFDFRTYHKVTYTDIPTTANYYYPSYVIDGGTLSILFKEALSNVSILSGGVEISHYDEISYYQTITIPNIHDDIEVKKETIVAKLVSGGINKVGSEVCIGKECFYIISNDGSTVSMLSKYNITLEENPVQSANNANNPNAEISFSDEMYWTERINYDYYLKDEYSDHYVYDSNSNLYEYVENYKNSITTPEVPILKVRLISDEEIKKLGCDPMERCTEAPEWVYTTEYWTGSLLNVGYYDDGVLLFFTMYGDYLDSYYDVGRHGIRPVIEMSVKDIEIPPPAKVISGDLDTVGSEICIDTECFYVISSTADTVTMLAKYNITTEPTSIQSSIGQYLAFSSTAYWGNDDGTPNSKYGTGYPAYVYDSNSLLYDHVENYKKYLQSKEIQIKNARLITYEEANSLGFKSLGNDNDINKTFNVIQSFWTGSANIDYDGPDILFRIYIIGNDGVFLPRDFYSSNNYGVRPVIEVPKWEFSNEVDFNIDGVTYQYKEGMTWNEWIDSKYNVDNFSIANKANLSTPYLSYRNLSSMWTIISSGELIDSSKNYIFQRAAEPPEKNPLLIVKSTS